MQNKIFSYLIILSIALFSSILFAKDDAKNNNNNIYTEDNLNISVTAKQPEFTLKLKSNPTTGYAWFLREYDSDIVKAIKHKFEKPQAKLIGAPGYELWTFRIKPKGFIVPQQTTIRMVYTRPWQTDSATQLVFRVSISGENS